VPSVRKDDVVIFREGEPVLAVIWGDEVGFGDDAKRPSTVGVYVLYHL
jgi:hypothetical protein